MDNISHLECSTIKLQNCLHNIINDYLNNVFLLKIFRLYEGQLLHIINNLKNNLKNDLLVSELSHWIHKRYVCPEIKLLNVIRIGYELLITKLSEIHLQLQKKSVMVPQQFKASDYPLEDSNYIVHIEAMSKIIQENLKDDISGLFLHGSWASLDYVKGYSDVDTLIILRQRTFNEIYRLKKMRKIIKQSLQHLFIIDPLMHHGHIFISEIDMTYYPENYFPLILFQYAKSCYSSDSQYYFMVRDDIQERQTILQECLIYVRNVCAGKIKFKSAFDIKFFASAVALLPNLYFQCQNKFYYKKDAIRLFCEDFPQEASGIISKVSELRRQWGYKEALLYKYIFILLKVMGVSLSSFILKAVPSSPFISARQILGTQFRQEGIAFVREIQRRSKINYSF